MANWAYERWKSRDKSSARYRPASSVNSMTVQPKQLSNVVTRWWRRHSARAATSEATRNLVLAANPKELCRALRALVNMVFHSCLLSLVQDLSGRKGQQIANLIMLVHLVVPCSN